jgi:hypothetical protein
MTARQCLAGALDAATGAAEVAAMDNGPTNTSAVEAGTAAAAAVHKGAAEAAAALPSAERSAAGKTIHTVQAHVHPTTLKSCQYIYASAPDTAGTPDARASKRRRVEPEDGGGKANDSAPAGVSPPRTPGAGAERSFSCKNDVVYAHGHILAVIAWCADTATIAEHTAC